MKNKILNLILILIISSSCSKAPSSTQEDNSDAEIQEQINANNRVIQKYNYILSILDFWDFAPAITQNTNTPINFDNDTLDSYLHYLKNVNYLKNELVSSKNQMIWFRDILDVSNLDNIFTPDADSKVHEFYLDLINVVGIYEQPASLIELADLKLNAIYKKEEIVHDWMIKNKDIIESRYPISDYWNFYNTLGRFNDYYKSTQENIEHSFKNEDFFKTNSLINDLDISFLFFEAMMSITITTIEKKEKYIEVRNEFNKYIIDIRNQLRSELKLANNSEQQLFFKLIQEIDLAKKQRDLNEEE